MKPDKRIMQKSFSPTRLAFMRLMKHRLALFGLFLIVGVSTTVIFVPMFYGESPKLTRVWLGANPPGFTHPDCSKNSIFNVGAVAETSNSLKGIKELIYETRTLNKREIRVKLRRGKVNSIVFTDGASLVDELDTSTLKGKLFRLNNDGTQGERLEQPFTIRKNTTPPEGLFETSSRVLLMLLVEADQEISQNIVTLDNFTVTSITTRKGNNATSSETLVIKGRDVIKVTSDGRVQTITHLLGTDKLGRDLFIRILYGGRISLLVGIVATLVSILVGLSYGAIAGYSGGMADSIMMRAVDILYGLPFIFLVILLMTLFERSLVLFFIALGLVQWLTVARIVRGQILSLREAEFVEAAKMSGATPWKIIFIHLIPHTIGPVIVYTTLTIPLIILEESFLAYIGLGIEGASDSLGSLVEQGVRMLGDSGENWWLLLCPALTMIFILFGMNCLGDGLRDSFDPKKAI
ncbi:MAG: ABC transporter permease [Candidatus Brocadiaceae bacterium]|nr:ABC transporter permease [Candidatus Brocadiaceae bacterium]